jgi:transposase InsO family protein
MKIRSDHGSEFGEKFKKLLRHRGVKHVQGTPHRPQVNGSAEKTVSNILNGLRAVAASAESRHMGRSPARDLVWAPMRPQASTRRSPYMLLYGKEPVIPAQQKRLPVLHENHQEDNEETPPGT